MSLTEEQKQTVAGWVAAGDNLSAVQKKLMEQLKISMTYMEVRFLVDDLNLQLKDAAPKASTDLSKPDAGGRGEPPPAPGKKGFLDKAKEKLGLGKGESEAGLPEEDEEAFDDAAAPAGAGLVQVTVDKVTLIPGAVASGTVSFSDGVTGKWMVDQYGRPGFTSVSQEGYRPTPADAQAFMQELSAALQQKGL